MPINEKREAIGRHAPADWWSKQFGDRGAAQLLFSNDPAMASAMVAEVFSGLARVIEAARPGDPR